MFSAIDAIMDTLFEVFPEDDDSRDAELFADVCDTIDAVRQCEENRQNG